MNELALFAGAGGGILGGKLLGWRTVCAVEWEAYPASVLCARQNDGLLPPFPIWDDVQTFDGKPWRGIVDVVSGGFPCQDISAAGKGAGIDGERSGMWGEMARIICEVRPKYVFVENSPMLTSRGLGRVLGDLATMGFDAKWGVLGAADIGANHKRDRIWICAKWGGQVSHPQHNRIRWWEQQQESIKKKAKISDTYIGRCESQNQPSPIEKANNQIICNGSPQHLADSQCLGREKRAKKCREPSDQETSNISGNRSQTLGNYGSSDWWAIEPNVGRVVDGMAARVDRLKAIENGQVPLCAATAWRILSGN